MLTNFLNNLQPTNLIITPNKRLSDWIEQQYNNHQTGAWKSLNILPFNRFIESLWNHALYQQLISPKILLSPNQCLLLWQTIIQTSTDLPLLDKTSTAKTALQAWDTLHAWLETDFTSNNLLNSDNQHFIEWKKRFESLCKEKNFITSSELPKIVTQLTHDKKLRLPDNIYLIGFLEHTPSQTQLWEACRNQKINIHDEQGIQPKQATLSICEAKNLFNELKQMAYWAKASLEKDESKEIACIIPNLTNIRSEVESVFREVFEAQTLQTHELPFTLSSGKKFSSLAIIATALNSLNLQETNDFETISNLLLSPFIAGAETEYQERALLDKALRQSNKKRLSIRECIKEAEKISPLFADLLHNLSAITQSKKTAPRQIHADSFFHKLLTLGWPGERTLNSEEYQAVEKFKTVLNEFCQLQVLNTNCTENSARYELTLLCKETLFQAESNKTARIHLLGTLEAAGIPFDQAWIMNLDDMTWPPSPNPNPFIPFGLQKSTQMPHATPERELTFSKTLLDQFSNQMGELVFSYHIAENESVKTMSPLLECFVHQAKPLAIALPALSNKQPLESFFDNEAPPINDETVIHGSSYLIQSQSACPFKGFATARLHAETLGEPHHGMDARERGILLHHVLELLWRRLKTQSQLNGLSENILLSIIESCITTAFSDLDYQHLPKAYLEIEKNRLEKLLMNFLEVEKTRPPFSVIACEKRQTIQLGKLKLKIQIDRIDQTETGKYILIDYKTSKPSTLSWYDERPKEPQLPLYTLNTSMKYSAAAFAQLQASECRYIGVAETNTLLPKVNEPKYLSWNELQEHWKSHLTELANEFINGYAAVTPRDNQACTYCDLQALCRIHEQMYTHHT